MSLTSQLADPNAPVSRFMNAQLPGDKMTDTYNRATRGLPPTIKPTGDLRHYPWPILGTAIDTRIRMWLGEAEHPGTAQGVRILRLTQTYNAHVPDATEAGNRLMERLKLHADRTTPLTDQEEDTAARYAILAARFEAIYRCPTPEQGRRAMGYFTDRPPYAGPDHPLSVLVRDIHPAWVADIRAQFDAARKALGHLRLNGVICGPTFSGSADVGQAEGDFIADGQLIDCKSTVTPALKPAQATRWFHQIAAYMLLDYKDEYQITHLGIYLARQRTLLTWSARGFLQHMGARHPLHVLRCALKQTLTVKDMP